MFKAFMRWLTAPDERRAEARRYYQLMDERRAEECRRLERIDRILDKLEAPHA